MAKAPSKDDSPIQWRRKADGYRVSMTDVERQGCIDADDYEPLDEFTARDIGPRDVPEAPLELTPAPAPDPAPPVPEADSSEPVGV